MICYCSIGLPIVIHGLPFVCGGLCYCSSSATLLSYLGYPIYTFGLPYYLKRATEMVHILTKFKVHKKFFFLSFRIQYVAEKVQ